jgi:hypothetical protein
VATIHRREIFEKPTGPFRLLHRRRRQLRVRLRVAALGWRNRFSSAPITDAGGPVVSLTSFGQRLERVHLAIESIGRGSLLPGRLILWLDETPPDGGVTKNLTRLVSRGLEIRAAGHNGPHNKYYGYVSTESDFAVPLVTADDDILYPGGWLQILAAAHASAPDTIHCFRALRVPVTPTGLLPYRAWPECTSAQASILNFATGVSGVIYPARFLRILREAGTGFADACPRADDIWLHAHAVRNDVAIHQLHTKSLHFLVVPRTQTVNLNSGNVSAGGNDQQIATTYSTQDIERLRDAPAVDRAR